VRQESDRRIWYDLKQGNILYCVFQHKEAKVPAWFIIASEIEGDRVRPMNMATRHENGEVAKADPLYVREELPLREWLRRLAQYCLSGGDPWAPEQVSSSNAKQEENKMTDSTATAKQPAIEVGKRWILEYDDREYEAYISHDSKKYNLSVCPIIERSSNSFSQSIVTSPLDTEYHELLRGVARRSRAKDAEAIALAEAALPELVQKVAAKGIAGWLPAPGVPDAVSAVIEDVASSFDGESVVILTVGALPNRWFVLRPNGVSWLRKGVKFIHEEETTWKVGQRLGGVEAPVTSYAGECGRAYNYTATYQCYELEPESKAPEFNPLARVSAYALIERDCEILAES